MPVLKNARHELFAQEMAKGSTVDGAYKKAGYSENRGNAARLNANESVIARIAEIQGRGAERVAVSVERIVRELGSIAFHDVTEMVRITKGGKTVKIKSTDEIPEELRAAIASIKKTKEGVEVKFHDKSKALDMLARHAGMFKERIDIHVGVSLVDLVLGSFPGGAPTMQTLPAKVDDGTE